MMPPFSAKSVTKFKNLTASRYTSNLYSLTNSISLLTSQSESICLIKLSICCLSKGGIPP